MDGNRLGEDTFINMLLDETYQETPLEESGKSSSDLLDYFDSKSREFKSVDSIDATLENYFVKNNIEINKFDYNSRTSCYRIILAGFTLDIPSNWSLFEQLHKSNRFTQGDLVVVDHDNDYDGLLQVMGPFADRMGKIVFFTNDRNIFMAFISARDESTINWIRNYLGIVDKSQVLMKLAA